jgi:hypothetical protein
MMTPRHESNTTGLIDSASRRTENAVARARDAIRRLERSGQPISFQLVARQAGVSRQFLYTRAELRDDIERLRALRLEQDGTVLPTAQRASDASLKARNRMLLDENKRLRQELADLREELAQAWGQLRALQRAQRRTGPKSVS